MAKRADMRPGWSGVLLVGLDQRGADNLGVTLAELRAAGRDLQPVALRSGDNVKLYRVADLLPGLGRQDQADAVRVSNVAAVKRKPPTTSRTKARTRNRPAAS